MMSRRLHLQPFALLLILAALAVTPSPDSRAAPAAPKGQAADDWPPITPEDRALTRVQQDPDADAVILSRTRSGKIIRKGDDTVNAMTVHLRLKVLNDRGKRFADQEIPEQKSSRVSNIQARTIKPDGTVVPVPPDQIFERLVSKVGGYKTTEHVFKFPAVEPGAILDLRYDRHSDYLLSIDPWYFAGPEYTLRSVVNQALPSDMAYLLRRNNCGDVQPITAEWREGKMKGRLFTIEMRNVPPYRDEIFMPPQREVSPSIEFVLAGWSGRYLEELGREERMFIDWPSVARFVRYHYKEAMRKVPSGFKDTVQGWVQGASDPKERIKAVLHHVQRDFAFLAYDEVLGGSRTVETLLKVKNADNEEKAVLLAAALKAIGIESHLALVSGKHAGSVNPKFYSLSQFTHMVVAVPQPDGTTMWIDPNVTYAPFGFQSSDDAGADALLLKTDEGELVTIPEKVEPGATKHRVTVRPRPDGKAELLVESEYSGEDAIEMRDDLAPAAEAARLSYLQDWVADHRSGAALKSHTIENLEDVDRPLVIKMEIEAPGLVTAAEGLLLVRGCALTCQDSNPMSRGSRLHPFFVQRGRNEEETVTIEPVEGMKAGTMPAPVIAQSQIASLSFSCASEANGGARCSRQFVERKSRAAAGSNAGIRAMYDKIVEADRTTVAFQQPEAAGAGGR